MSRYVPRIDRAGLGGGGAEAVDHFTAGIIVGNELEGDPGDAQAAPFQYVADPGNGTGIESALTAAAARGVDVYLRPGTYTIDPASVTLPMTIPAGTRLKGAGRGVTEIVGGDGSGGTTQEIFDILSAGELRSVRVQSPAPAAAPAAGTTVGVIRARANAIVDDCEIEVGVNGGGGTPRTQEVGILGTDGVAVIRDSNFIGADGFAQQTGAEIIAILFASELADESLLPAQSGRVEACRFSGWNIGAAWFNCARGVVRGCTFVDMHLSEGVMRWRTDSAFTSAVEVRGPRWVENSIFMADVAGQTAPQNRVGAFMDVDHDGSKNGPVTGFYIDDLRVMFEAQTLNFQVSHAVWVRAGANTQGSIVFSGSIDNIVTREQAVGVRLSAAHPVVSFIDSVRVGNVVAANAAVQGGIGGRGAWFETGDGSQINNCSIMNSALHNAATAGVELENGCTDTHVGFNQLKTGAGTPLVDSGTGTEPGHNILV